MICTNLHEMLNSDFYTATLSVSRLISPETKCTHVCNHGQRVYSRFFYVICGNVSFTFFSQSGASQTLRAASGDIIYLPDDIAYTCEWDSINEIDYISVEFRLKSPLEETILLSNEMFIITHDTHAILLDEFERLFTMFTAGTLGYRLKCRSMFCNLLCVLLEEGIRTDSQNGGIIYKSILFVENNYMTDFSVTELAKRCGLCETNFRLLFKKETGMSPVRYKNYLKIKKAADLLKSGEYTVSEAATLVNIMDLCYFSKLFKRYFHVSPITFRRESSHS